MSAWKLVCFTLVVLLASQVTAKPKDDSDARPPPKHVTLSERDIRGGYDKGDPRNNFVVAEMYGKPDPRTPADNKPVKEWQCGQRPCPANPKAAASTNGNGAAGANGQTGANGAAAPKSAAFTTAETKQRFVTKLDFAAGSAKLMDFTKKGPKGRQQRRFPRKFLAVQREFEVQGVKPAKARTSILWVCADVTPDSTPGLSQERAMLRAKNAGCYVASWLRKNNYADFVIKVATRGTPVAGGQAKQGLLGALKTGLQTAKKTAGNLFQKGVAGVKSGLAALKGKAAGAGPGSVSIFFPQNNQARQGCTQFHVFRSGKFVNRKAKAPTFNTFLNRARKVVKRAKIAPFKFIKRKIAKIRIGKGEPSKLNPAKMIKAQQQDQKARLARIAKRNKALRARNKKYRKKGQACRKAKRKCAKLKKKQSKLKKKLGRKCGKGKGKGKGRKMRFKEELQTGEQGFGKWLKKAGGAIARGAKKVGGAVVRGAKAVGRGAKKVLKKLLAKRKDKKKRKSKRKAKRAAKRCKRSKKRAAKRAKSLSKRIKSCLKRAKKVCKAQKKLKAKLAKTRSRINKLVKFREELPTEEAAAPASASTETAPTATEVPAAAPEETKAVEPATSQDKAPEETSLVEVEEEGIKGFFKKAKNKVKGVAKKIGGAVQKLLKRKKARDARRKKQLAQKRLAALRKARMARARELARRQKARARYLARKQKAAVAYQKNLQKYAKARFNAANAAYRKKLDGDLQHYCLSKAGQKNWQNSNFKPAWLDAKFITKKK